MPPDGAPVLGEAAPEVVAGDGMTVESWTRTLRAGFPAEVSRTWQVMRSFVCWVVAIVAVEVVGGAGGVEVVVVCVVWGLRFSLLRRGMGVQGVCGRGWAELGE